MEQNGMRGKDIDFSYTIYNLKKALDNAKEFPSDLNFLETEIGTNIPDLMKAIGM